MFTIYLPDIKIIEAGMRFSLFWRAMPVLFKPQTAWSLRSRLNRACQQIRNGDFMEKITSFTINHILLEPGLYVSRKDRYENAVITTFDIRITSPNDEPVMNTAEMHTIEHLGATFLRNHPDFAEKCVYFGPMGCRTGFYFLAAGDYSSRDILPLMTEMFEFIRDFEGEIPGAQARDCGNYLDQNLGMAKYIAKRYLDNTLSCIDEAHLIYPED